MGRALLSLLMLPSLFLSCQCFSVGDGFDVLDDAIYAVQDFVFFFPNVEIILKKVALIGRLIHGFQPLFGSDDSADSENIKSILNAVKTISASIKRIETDMMDQLSLKLPEQIDISHKLHDIQVAINSININYADFLKHSDNNTIYDENAVKDHNDFIIRLGHRGLSGNLRLIICNVLELPECMTVGRSNFLQVYADRQKGIQFMCLLKQSPQHRLKTLYGYIILAEIQVIIMYECVHKSRIDRNVTNSLAAHKNEINAYVSEACSRISTTIKTFREYMKYSSRNFWNCDASPQTEGTTYLKLGPIFQRYILVENDGGTYDRSSLSLVSVHENNGCSAIKQVFDSCYSGKCRVDLHRSNRCHGIVRDCEFIDSTMKICKSELGIGRRYNYIRLINKEEDLGNTNTCEDDQLTSITWRDEDLLTPGVSDNCFCTCDDVYNNYTLRYFSLRDVISDVKDKKVITGARFVSEGNMIYIQIMQGTVKKYGNIDDQSCDWKPVHSFNVFNHNAKNGRDYHRIEWDARRVNIDTLDAPPNKVLTGLRFALDNKALKLEIRYTPFNFTSGDLDDDMSIWYSKPSKDSSIPRMEINRNGNELPLRHVNRINEEIKGFVTFKTSSLETDVGQTVVPYIDAQQIYPTPLTLLSGAGIDLRYNAMKSSGFLTLKLVTYDYSGHLDDTFNSKKTMNDHFANIELQN